MPRIPPVPATIRTLSDQDLADSLREYNVNVGPIVASTRGVYERKLFKLQSGPQAAPIYEPGEEEEEDDDEEDEAQEADEESEDEEVVLKQQQPRLRTTRSSRPEASGTPRGRPGIHDHMSRSSPPRKAQSVSSQSASKGGIPAWVKLLIIVVIAVIVFLVIKNMESDPASEIPEQIEVKV